MIDLMANDLVAFVVFTTLITCLAVIVNRILFGPDHD